MLFVNKLKVLTLMTCLVLVGQGFAGNCAADYVPPENAVWDGSTKTEPCMKDGFYIIDNAAKLAWYAKNYDKGNAKLTADIDLGGKLWTPIAAGQGNAKYSKTFDGNGHVIKNMYINGTELAQIDKNYAQNLGFIGTLGNTDSKKPGGKVKNLIFENVDIQASTNAGDILGRDDSQISVGVVIGWMAENDSNLVDNCVAASGTIRTTGKGQGVGGIVGNAKKGTISNCMSLVEIRTSGADAYIGGIIGITKTNVTVSSCVYAGPGLVNTGSNGLTGGVVGNVYSGTIATENNYFEGDSIAGVGGTSCSKNCTPTVTDSALIAKANTNAVKVDTTNADSIACALNGLNTDSTCKEEPWSVGLTGLSLNGYGADGYKIVFNANGGVFADGKNTTNKFLQAGMTITADEIVSPSRENFSFVGWALTSDAAEVAENLGIVSGKDTIFAVWTPVYTITFNVAPGVFPESGEIEETKQVASGDVITVEGLGALPSSRCKVYATEDECETWSYFTGWALTEGASESDSVSLDTVAASDELVLYAVWTDVETYTVTYNANLHGRTTVDYVRVGAGDTVAAPTDPIADTGYVFDGWFTDAEGVNQYQFAAQIHESIILYAKWVLDTFTVAYEMNGVSSAGENPVSYTIETPTFALAAPADVDGYVFEGWFYDSNFTSPASQVIQGTTGDKTFYAKWTKKSYRIMYLADNNSQGAVTDQFKEYGTPFTLESAGHFNRLGYVQTGWATVAEGAKVYDFGASYEVEAPLTLYPSWSDPIVYTITYVCDVCTETNPSKPRTYTVNNTKNGNYALYNPTFSSNEYEFVGWFWDEAYTKRTTNIPKGTVGDTVLYGKMLKKYTITYELNGGTKANNRTSYTKEIETFALQDATGRENYTFAGWFDNAEFEGDAVTEIVKGSEGDKIFYAKWIPEVYSIVYHNIEGATFETPNPETYTVEDEFPIVLNEPAKVGFNFLGWSLTENSTEYVDGIAAGSIGEANFYAKWELAPSPITVTASSGTFEYDGETHNATCSYEGTLPVGYSIEMVPNGSVRNVSAEPVTTSCDVTITDESGDDVTSLFTELTIVNGSMSVVEMEDDYGAIVVYTSEKGKRAELNGSYNGSISDGIPNDLEVDSIQFNRKFPISEVSGEGYSTIVLPFTIDQSKIVGAKFYQLAYVDGDNVAIYEVADAVQANTPYIIRTSAQTLKFNLGEDETVTFNFGQMNNTLSSDKMWELRGMYSYKKWEAGNEELGRAYGFTTKVIGENGIGSFARNAAGAYIYPFRVYLYHYSAPVQRARALAKSASISSIDEDSQPGSLNVIIVDPETEETTVIGKLNPATGEVKVIDNWYDMKGRRLNAKPTTKGIYYFNGKRVIIK